MIHVMDAMHYVLTGINFSSLLNDSANMGTAGSGVMSGVTVFAGLDRLPSGTPAVYPYCIIEPDRESQSYGNQGVALYTVNLAFSVLVPGNQGALVGRTDTGEAGILDWQRTVKNLLLGNQRLMLSGAKLTSRIDSIETDQFLSSDERGIIFSRGFEMRVTYRGVNWTGE